MTKINFVCEIFKTNIDLQLYFNKNKYFKFKLYITCRR